MPTLHPTRFGRLATIVPALAFSALLFGPYLPRLTTPSLYADDVDRVVQLQTVAFGQLVFLPFNEHVAPLFQTLSWIVWRLAGQRLGGMPVGLTVASFLPFPPTLALIGWVVRRETRSGSAALAALAIFGISWLAIETVYWYSASSFMWALLATLAAWLAAVSASESGKPWCGALAGLASAVAPAFSAVGLLAGPAATVRALATPGGRRLAALSPLAGTLAALIVYAAIHDRAALASGVGRDAAIGRGLLAALRAPTASLLPALIGLRTWEANGPVMAGGQAVLAIVAALGLLVWSGRSGDRPAVLGGLTLIFGGYALTFCARAGEPGRALLETQRYHLFPMLGLVFVLAPALRGALRRWDGRPLVRRWGAVALAAALLAVHGSEIRGRARFMRHPEQVKTLAAIDRLGVVCARDGIGRDQARAALGAIEPSWSPPGRDALVLLAPDVRAVALSARPRVPDALVRATLLAALTPDERRALLGAMDATPYLRADVETAPSDVVSEGRRVARFRVRDAGGDRCLSSGWPSFLEYEFPGASSSAARGLVLSGVGPGDVVELWWRGDRQRWSESRSVRLHPRSDPLSPRLWRLALDQIPHWSPSDPLRVRLMYHASGPVALAAPRLVK